MPRGQRTGHRWRQLRARVLDEEDVCYWCGLPVDKDLPGTHPAGPSVEHLLPLAQGGSLLDRDNVTLAHLGCNVSRGSRARPGNRRRGLHYTPPPSVTQRRW